MAPGMGAALEAGNPASCSLEASRAPTPPPRWMVYGAGRAVREGGEVSDFISLCLVFPLLLCPYLDFLFRSSFYVIISLLVPSPVYLII